MDAAVHTLLSPALSTARVCANMCVRPCASCLYPEYLAQPAEHSRCQQFTASPERKVPTPALLVKAVICVLAAYSPRSKPQIRNQNVLYCCL